MSNRLRGFSLVLMGLYLLVVGGRAIGRAARGFAALTADVDSTKSQARQEPFRIRVLGRAPSSAQTTDVSHSRNMLVRSLREATDLRHTEIKRLVKALVDGAPVQICLRDRELTRSICMHLDLIGAKVELDFDPPQ